MGTYRTLETAWIAIPPNVCYTPTYILGCFYCFKISFLLKSPSMECLLSLLTISRSREVADSYHFFSLTLNGVGIIVFECKKSTIFFFSVLQCSGMQYFCFQNLAFYPRIFKLTMHVEYDIPKVDVSSTQMI